MSLSREDVEDLERRSQKKKARDVRYRKARAEQQKRIYASKGRQLWFQFEDDPVDPTDPWLGQQQKGKVVEL